MNKRALSPLLLGAILIPALPRLSGGWAVITVSEVPDYVVAGEETQVEFSVRQHGQNLLAGLQASVEAKSGRTRVESRARPGNGAGTYLATLRVPSEGDWTITVNSGFGNSRTTLVPIRAVPKFRLASFAALAESERGRRLFVAKGCQACHEHVRAPGKGIGSAVSLTGKRFAPEYLRMYLADPSIRPPSQPTSFRMPNLGLKPGEITALTAFLNEG